MRNHRIPSRPHLQGDPAPLRLRHSARKLTDGAGLVLLRRLWDQWDLGAWLDERTAGIPGRYRPSLMVEVWTTLLCWRRLAGRPEAAGRPGCAPGLRVEGDSRPDHLRPLAAAGGPRADAPARRALWRLVRTRWQETGRQASLNGRPPDPPHVAGGPALARETARRLACDAGLVAMLHGEDGQVLDVGRRTRSVPPAMRRALDHRDRGCRFPGCGSRFCDAHHLVPWAEGGATRLDNLVLLCRHHHRRVHEDGWRIELTDDATADGRPAVRVHRPDGGRLPPVPSAPAVPEDPAAELEHRQQGLGIDEWTATPDGVAPPLDVDFALYALMPPLESLERRPADGDEQQYGGGEEASTETDGSTGGSEESLDGPGDVSAEP